MPPAARVGDNHTCPSFTGPTPHVGGPIIPPGSTDIYIDGVPAARTTDQAACAAGPPDVLAMGCPTVFMDFLLAVRTGDLTAHAGVVGPGSTTVEIGMGGDGVAVMPIVLRPKQIAQSAKTKSPSTPSAPNSGSPSASASAGQQAAPQATQTPNSPGSTLDCKGNPVSIADGKITPDGTHWQAGDGSLHDIADGRGYSWKDSQGQWHIDTNPQTNIPKDAIVAHEMEHINLFEKGYTGNDTVTRTTQEIFAKKAGYEFAVKRYEETGDPRYLAYAEMQARDHDIMLRHGIDYTGGISFDQVIADYGGNAAKDSQKYLLPGLKAKYP